MKEGLPAETAPTMAEYVSPNFITLQWNQCPSYVQNLLTSSEWGRICEFTEGHFSSESWGNSKVSKDKSSALQVRIWQHPKKVNHSIWAAPIVAVPDNMVNSILVGITRYHITLNYGRSRINTGSPLMVGVNCTVIKLNLQYSAV